MAAAVRAVEGEAEVPAAGPDAPSADDLVAWLAAGAPVHPGGERLAALTGAADRQEVTILSRPLSDPHAPLLVTWSLLTGAALLLEPGPRTLLATTLWARPTLFLGSGEEIRRLAAETRGAPSPLAALAAHLRRLLGALGTDLKPSPPLGRLHTVIVAAESDAEAHQTAKDTWSQRRVRLLKAEDLLE